MNKTNRTLLAVPLLVISCGLAIIATYTLLNPRIVEQQRLLDEAVYIDTLELTESTDVQVISTHTTDDSPLLGLRTSKPIYIARTSDRVIGIVLPLTAREGYVGDIDLLLGIDANGYVISVRVLSQRETRDLGDKIDPSKSSWLEQFRGAAFEEANKSQWQLRNEGGQFDGITGATVTSRAVIKAIQQGLVYFAEHRDNLLEKNSAGSNSNAEQKTQ